MTYIWNIKIRNVSASLLVWEQILPIASVTHVGKALHSTTSILEAFDHESSLKPKSGYHTTRSSDADMAKLLNNSDVLFWKTPLHVPKSFKIYFEV